MPEAGSGTVALVTGASRGIGQAIVEQLAARGVRVALHCREQRVSADRLRARLPGHGHAVYVADLADRAAAAGLWSEVRDGFGHIDLLINNAAVYLEHPPLTTDPERWAALWAQTLSINLVSAAQLCQLAARAMAAGNRTRSPFGKGRIVNISSRGAFRGEPDAPAYGASKAGLNALSQSLARALAAHEVYVYCIAPGWVATDMAAAHLAGPNRADILAQHPLGRVATPGEIANAAVYCALDAPATMTGCIIDVNGASYLRT
jgi:NAD(P)-dependent dehydrogenase (short-subunit alcohol dehydrogenase family)